MAQLNLKTGLLVSAAVALALFSTGCATAYVDTSGRRIDPRVEHFAERTVDSGRIVVYQPTREDTVRLVADLREAGVTDASFLDPAFWQPWCVFNSAVKKCGGSCFLPNRVCVSWHVGDAKYIGVPIEACHCVSPG